MFALLEFIPVFLRGLLTVRTLIQAGVTTGGIVLLENIFTPLFEKAIKAVAKLFGLSDQEATDVVANEVIQSIETVGELALVIKSNMPSRIADRLGFSTKGYAKRKLSTATEAKVAGKSANVKSVGVVGLDPGKGMRFALYGLLGWNALTDWVWIGNSLGFLPDDAKNDIQKRALSIQQLIEAPRSIVYAAEKIRRQLSQQERELIKDVAGEAQRQINELKQIYENKFVLFGQQDVLTQLKSSTSALTLELATMEQLAGLIPRQPVQKKTTEARVTVVFDGDTVKLDNDETVRLLGIDAPESTTPEGEKSKAYLKERLTGQSVRVESDPDALVDIYGRRLGVIFLNDINVNIEMLQKGLAIFYMPEANALVFEKQWKAAATGSRAQPSFIPSPKVFTGLISQGRLGQSLEFTPRPNDLISSVNELQQAAQNNLASYLTSLPGRVTYEIRILASVTTKDGSTKRGQAQRIVSGYHKDGTPKYRTVVNKFAVLYLYILTERGTRTRIATVILGPTDALKFQPVSNDLTLVETTLKSTVATKNTAEIVTIAPPVIPAAAAAAPAPTFAQATPPVPAAGPAAPAPAAAPAPTPAPPPINPVAQSVKAIYGTPVEQMSDEEINYAIQNLQQIIDAQAGGRPASALFQEFGLGAAADYYGMPPQRLAIYNVLVTRGIVTRRPGQAAPAPTATAATPLAPVQGLPAPTQKPGANATTLYEWYQANGKALPGVQARSTIYESFGLGPAAFYVGTAEQNTRLLAELKK